MKIFQLVDNPYEGNPYVSTLMDGINRIDEEITWGYGINNFWDEEIFSYNIIHIHWPHYIVPLFPKEDIIERFEKRLIELKKKGVKIIATCHNMEPHYEKNQNKIEAYQITYKNADCILHLGEYSLNLLKNKYPAVKHILLPHHTYDNLYKIKDRYESVKKLQLNPSKKYILCFGAFRDDEERDMINRLLKQYKTKTIEILAPHYYNFTKRRNKIKMFIAWLKSKYKIFNNKRLHIYGKYISDDILPYFFGAADICLIQRKRILNSGNLPLAFFMGKVVVGPNVGNVGRILEETNNPSFDPENDNSLIKAIDMAFQLENNGFGIKNKQYSEDNWSTAVIAERLYKIYKTI